MRPASANESRDKGAALARANLALEKTRIWVRLGFELRFMNLKQYECGSKAVIRGGNWDNGANAGVFAFNANNGPSNWNDSVGFRCCGRAAPFIRRGRMRKTWYPGEAW